jgi:predicted nucleic acid-binding protein
MLLLDSSALIDLEAELASGQVGPMRAYLSRHKGEGVACSTISVGELAAGKNEAAVRVLLSRIRKIHVSEVIAYRAGELERSRLRHGMRIGGNDTWIAATALCFSATLVHTDADFERVPALKRMHPGRP